MIERRARSEHVNGSAQIYTQNPTTQSKYPTNDKSASSVCTEIHPAEAKLSFQQIFRLDLFFNVIFCRCMRKYEVVNFLSVFHPQSIMTKSRHREPHLMFFKWEAGRNKTCDLIDNDFIMRSRIVQVEIQGIAVVQQILSTTYVGTEDTVLDAMIIIIITNIYIAL